MLFEHKCIVIILFLIIIINRKSIQPGTVSYFVQLILVGFDLS